MIKHNASIFIYQLVIFNVEDVQIPWRKEKKNDVDDMTDKRKDQSLIVSPKITTKSQK